MYEIWVYGTCWLRLPSVDACKQTMTTYDPDGTVPILIRDTDRQRFLSYEEVWGRASPTIPLPDEFEKEIDWALEGF